jgi:hypothetical protein
MPVRAAVKGKKATVKGVLNGGLTARTLIKSGLRWGVKPVKGKSSTAQQWVEVSNINKPQSLPLGIWGLTL